MDTNNKWSSAALNGLILSAITVIYTLIAFVFEPAVVISILLWTVKFIGTNYMLYFFMKQYSAQRETISYGESFNYGFLVSTLSAIVGACFSFISYEFLFPESAQVAMEKAMEAVIAQGMTSEEEEIISKWMERISEIALFVTLIYYTIYGAIASSIIANFTKETDPFAGESF